MTGYQSKKKAASAKTIDEVNWADHEPNGRRAAQKPWPEEPFGHMAGGVQPPQRTWVGLTAEEAAECWTTSATQTWKNFEAKLKEKNNG